VTPAVSHRYLAYGLRVASELELWPSEAREANAFGPSDVQVVCGDSVGAAPQRAQEFDWPGLARIRVLDGRKIVVSADPEADPRELAAAITGPALAAALGQRGLLALHGTCVAFDGWAVCLLGESGAGKSTLAAALCAQGGALVSDTMTVVDFEQGAPVVRVGPAQFKLWPDAARSLGWNPDALPEAVPGSDKRLCPFHGKMAATGVRLEHLFALSAGAPVALGRVAPSAAVVTLLHNHFLAAYLGLEQSKHWLPWCARLVEGARLHTLRRGDSLVDLKLAMRVVSDAKALPAA